MRGNTDVILDNAFSDDSTPENRLGLDEVIDEERDAISSCSSSVVNCVFIGEYSGELRLRIDPQKHEDALECGVRDTLKVTDVAITRTEVKDAQTDGPNVTYHALVIGFTENERGHPEPFQHRESFLHPMRAYGWVEETVPGFDVFPVETVCGPILALEDECVVDAFMS